MSINNLRSLFSQLTTKLCEVKGKSAEFSEQIQQLQQEQLIFEPQYDEDAGFDTYKSNQNPNRTKIEVKIRNLSAQKNNADSEATQIEGQLTKLEVDIAAEQAKKEQEEKEKQFQDNSQNLGKLSEQNAANSQERISDKSIGDINIQKIHDNYSFNYNNLGINYNPYEENTSLAYKEDGFNIDISKQNEAIGINGNIKLDSVSFNKNNNQYSFSSDNIQGTYNSKNEAVNLSYERDSLNANVNLNKHEKEANAKIGDTHIMYKKTDNSQNLLLEKGHSYIAMGYDNEHKSYLEAETEIKKITEGTNLTGNVLIGKNNYQGEIKLQMDNKEAYLAYNKKEGLRLGAKQIYDKGLTMEFGGGISNNGIFEASGKVKMPINNRLNVYAQGEINTDGKKRFETGIECAVNDKLLIRTGIEYDGRDSSGTIKIIKEF